MIMHPFRGHFCKLIRIHQKVYHGNGPVESKRCQQSQGNNHTPHVDGVADQAETRISSGAEAAGKNGAIICFGSAFPSALHSALPGGAFSPAALPSAAGIFPSSSHGSLRQSIRRLPVPYGSFQSLSSAIPLLSIRPDVNIRCFPGKS